MRTLVTGGAGFIGSTLVDRLLHDGHSVDVVDNFSSGSLRNLELAHSHGDALRMIEIDIRDPSFGELISTGDFEVIFHLAAQPSVVSSMENPVLDADVNVMGSLRLIDAARSSGVRKIVFAASGGTLYGDVPVERLPARESYPYQPTSPYGLSKMIVVHYLKMYRELYGLDFTALALANVYGPRQDPHGEAGVVAIFSDLIASGRVPNVFGDGEQTRDFVYVDDVVDAFVRAANQTGSAEVINVGTGVETSVNVMLEHLSKAFDVPMNANYLPAREGELQRSSLAASKAETILSWSAKIPIATGVRRIVETRYKA
jgi:UDP-glucose 4-epimerase